MSKTIVSLSSNSIDKAIDEYHDSTSYNGSSSTSNSSSEGNTTEEESMFGVPRVTLEVPQEQLWMRAGSGSRDGTLMNVPPSSPLDKVKTVYNCVIGIPSKTSEQRLNLLRTWYQIPDEFNPRLAIHREWCYNPHFGIGVYEDYFLRGFRLPLNAFARELLVRLGLVVCQFNPNAWRLIISLQILWRKVFGGDRPLTVDKFLFCYKPLEINQSLGLYQFIARGTNCRLIKSLVSSERNWKTEFFFISGFWVGNPAKVGRDTFALYTRDLGNLRLEGMPLPPPFFSLSFFYFLFIYLFLSFVYERLTFLFFFFNSC